MPSTARRPAARTRTRRPLGQRLCAATRYQRLWRSPSLDHAEGLPVDPAVLLELREISAVTALPADDLRPGCHLAGIPAGEGVSLGRSSGDVRPRPSLLLLPAFAPDSIQFDR